MRTLLCVLLLLAISAATAVGTRFVSKEAEEAYMKASSSYQGGSFSMNQANISAYLSAAAYCGKDSYATMTLKGPAEGFQVVHTIYHDKSDTQGYVGLLHSDSSIYVVFRGSSSIPNWIMNMDVVKTPYTSFGDQCKDCNVHKGWYLAEQAVAADVASTVASLREQYPTYAVKLTGHSLGAALAQFMSLDLVALAGIHNSLINFGQPRTGDLPYATFVPSIVPATSTWRVTHNQDVVPHLPPSSGMDFVHVCTEQFEDGQGVYTTCSGSVCEDPACADQFPIEQTNTDDHCTYLSGMPICDCNHAAVV